MSDLESKALDIVERHKSGGNIPVEDAKVIFDYCGSVVDTEHGCPKCALRKKFGKCPIVISLP
jgi:hypothetical protein